MYPPEIAKPALYVKELAKRLKEKKHEIVVITYSNIPEKVPGVRIVAINKRLPLPIRLFLFVIALMRASLRADIIYSQNGASVELPAGLVALITRRPLIIHMIDNPARQKTASISFLKQIESFALKHARKVITDIPMERPEVLPFKPMPTTEYDAYNKSWDAHIDLLQNTFKDIYKNA